MKLTVIREIRNYDGRQPSFPGLHEVRDVDIFVSL